MSVSYPFSAIVGQKDLEALKTAYLEDEGMLEERG